jgi:beta-glucosidase
LDRRTFAFYDPETADWVVEAGDFEILVGASSHEIRLDGMLRIDPSQASAPINGRQGLEDYKNLSKDVPMSREAFEA